MVESGRSNDKPASMLEAAVIGEDMYIREDYSHNMIDVIIARLEQDYGITLQQHCRSMCG